MLQNAGRFRLRGGGGGTQIALENRKSMKLLSLAIKRGRDSLQHSSRLNGFFYGSLLTDADADGMYPPHTSTRTKVHKFTRTGRNF